MQPSPNSSICMTAFAQAGKVYWTLWLQLCWAQLEIALAIAHSEL